MTKPRVLITSRLFTFTAESSQAVLRKSLSPILIRLQASLGSRAPCLICGKKKKTLSNIILSIPFSNIKLSDTLIFSVLS